MSWMSKDEQAEDWMNNSRLRICLSKNAWDAHGVVKKEVVSGCRERTFMEVNEEIWECRLVLYHGKT